MLPRDIDWQVLDARLLNGLRVERHQRQYFLRHSHFDWEPQGASFSCGKCVVMSPVTPCKLIRKGFRSSLLHPRRQQLYRPSLNLGESFLPHIGENHRQVEDILNRL